MTDTNEQMTDTQVFNDLLERNSGLIRSLQPNTQTRPIRQTQTQTQTRYNTITQAISEDFLKQTFINAFKNLFIQKLTTIHNQISSIDDQIIVSDANTSGVILSGIYNRAGQALAYSLSSFKRALLREARTILRLELDNASWRREMITRIDNSFNGYIKNVPVENITQPNQDIITNIKNEIQTWINQNNVNLRFSYITNTPNTIIYLRLVRM